MRSGPAARSVAKALLPVLVLACAAATVTVAPAAAKAPCAQAVINDWFDNGVVDQRFPTHCYRDAIRQLPTDVETYSSAKDDIQRALLAVLRGGNGNNGGGGDASAKRGGDATSKRSEPDRRVTSASPERGRQDAEKPSKGIIRSTIEWLGPSDAASVPLPLLVLAGIAFLLLAAAGGSFLNRRLQARRLPPPT